jgi:hypothetical protein
VSELEKLQTKLKLAGLTRPVWLPLTEFGEKSTSESKFAGKPWLHADENWPRCQNCLQPMQLMLQLNCADLPAEMQAQAGRGLIQLFYCVNTDPFCAIDCEAWYPFAKSVLAAGLRPMAQVLSLIYQTMPFRLSALSAGKQDQRSIQALKRRWIYSQSTMRR